MTASFFDRQDKGNRHNGTRIERVSELTRVLSSVAGRAPHFAELIGDNGCTLLIGIGPVGCAQFSETDGGCLAQMAVAPLPSAGPGFVDFLIGDTATPVPSRYCMPFDVVARIAGEFIRTGGRCPDVTWEEI